MGREGIANQLSAALALARATPGQQRTAAILAIVALCVFLVVAPFVRIPLARMPAFIPAYQTALFFIDLITAVLLVDQFLRLRSTALLVLAAGYLFDALIIVSHTLSFPGAFAPTGMLGAREQTTAWLYVFWHGGFPLFVMGYAILRRREGTDGAWAALHPYRQLALATLGVAALVVGLTLLATRGHDWLPVVMRGGDYSLLVSKGISPAVWLLTALALFTLWRRPLPVMDLWLMLVMWVWLFDIALSAVLGSSRFDLGFYAGRIFGLIAAGFLLVALLVEMARMYADALSAVDRVAADKAAVARAAAEAEPPRAEAAPAVAQKIVEPEETPTLSRTGSVAAFIRQRNIAHYEALLASGQLSDSERHTIGELLSRELRSA